MVFGIEGEQEGEKGRRSTRFKQMQRKICICGSRRGKERVTRRRERCKRGTSVLLISSRIFFLFSRRDKFVSRHHPPLPSPLPKRYNFPFSSKSSPANRNGYATLHAQYENFNQVLKTREKVVVSLKFARNLSNAAIKAKGVKKIRCVYKYSRRRRRTTINLGKKRRRE